MASKQPDTNRSLNSNWSTMSANTTNLTIVRFDSNQTNLLPAPTVSTANYFFNSAAHTNIGLNYDVWGDKVKRVSFLDCQLKSLKTKIVKKCGLDIGMGRFMSYVLRISLLAYFKIRFFKKSRWNWLSTFKKNIMVHLLKVSIVKRLKCGLKVCKTNEFKEIHTNFISQMKQKINHNCPLLSFFIILMFSRIHHFDHLSKEFHCSTRHWLCTNL